MSSARFAAMVGSVGSVGGRRGVWYESMAVSEMMMDEDLRTLSEGARRTSRSLSDLFNLPRFAQPNVLFHHIGAQPEPATTLSFYCDPTGRHLPT